MDLDVVECIFFFGSLVWIENHLFDIQILWICNVLMYYTQLYTIHSLFQISTKHFILNRSRLKRMITSIIFLTNRISPSIDITSIDWQSIRWRWDFFMVNMCKMQYHIVHDSIIMGFNVELGYSSIKWVHRLEFMMHQ